MNASEYARHRGVRPPLVSAWIKKGYLGDSCKKIGGRYEIDAERADQILRDGLDPNFTRISPTNDQGNDTGPSFAEARRQKEHYLAELRKLELEEKSGQLVKAEEVQALLEKLISQARVKLLGIKSQLAPLVCEAIGDAAGRERLLTAVETIINETLLDLSNDTAQ